MLSLSHVFPSEVNDGGTVGHKFASNLVFYSKKNSDYNSFYCALKKALVENGIFQYFINEKYKQ